MSPTNQIIKEHGVTRIQGKEVIYVWSIENFKYYQYNNTSNVIRSPIFPTNKDVGCKWQLALYAESSNDSLCLELVLHEDDKSKKTVNMLLSVIDKRKTTNVLAVRSFTLESGMYNRAIHRDLLKRNDVMNDKNGILSHGTLNIRCELYFPEGTINFTRKQNAVTSIENIRSQNFERLFDSKVLCDVTLSVGAQQFQAHKCVLAAQSKVFSAMFEHNMREKNENLVTIKDVDPPVMFEVLRFIYCGKFNDNQNAADLLIAANKYELEELGYICEQKLIDNLSLDNVGETLILADRYKIDTLKKSVLQFIALHLKEINFEKFKGDVEAYSPLLADMLKEFI